MRIRMKMKIFFFKKNKLVKDANIKGLIEEPKEIKRPNWLDKIHFNYYQQQQI